MVVGINAGAGTRGDGSQETGVRRRATIIHRRGRRGRRRGDPQITQISQIRRRGGAARDDNSPHGGCGREELGVRRQEIPISGSCRRGLARRLGRFRHPCLPDWRLLSHRDFGIHAFPIGDSCRIGISASMPQRGEGGAVSFQQSAVSDRISMWPLPENMVAPSVLMRSTDWPCPSSGAALAGGSVRFKLARHGRTIFGRNLSECACRGLDAVAAGQSE